MVYNFRASVNKSVIAACRPIDPSPMHQTHRGDFFLVVGLGSKYPVSMFGHRFIVSYACRSTSFSFSPVFFLSAWFSFTQIDRERIVCIPKNASCHRECATNKTKEIKKTNRRISINKQINVHHTPIEGGQKIKPNIKRAEKKPRT